MSKNSIINILNQTKKFNSLYDIPQELFFGKKCNKCAKGLKILILNTPCGGFGDLIFAHKLASFLREWYNIQVTIASTLSERLKTLGEKSQNLIKLDGKTLNECRRFRHLKFLKKIPKYDLIFVAPMSQDFDPDRRDVKALIPYSNPFNTFIFSEYNDSLQKQFDFHTGIGKNRLGLLFTDTGKLSNTHPKVKYAVAYIAEDVPNSFTCFFAFVEMVSAKYNKHKFEIIVPKWVAEIIKDNPKKIKKLEKYFGKIQVDLPNKKKVIFKEHGSTLVIRGDVFPVPNKKMLSLIKYSVKDILLTGDQSITDALSCCKKKNIFYQIAPWKESFGRALAKQLPNKFLFKKKTSCGTLSALNYNSDYKDFVKNNDFRKNARPKLDSIIWAAKKRKTDKNLQKFEKLVLASRKLDVVKEKYE